MIDPKTDKELLAFLLLPVAIFFDGFVISKLWAWHIVPAFHAPPLCLNRLPVDENPMVHADMCPFGWPPPMEEHRE